MDLSLNSQDQRQISISASDPEFGDHVLPLSISFKEEGEDPIEEDQTSLPPHEGGASESESSSKASLTTTSDVLLSETVVNEFPFIYSDSDTDNNATQNKATRKKRSRNEKNWKKNLRKENRLIGKEYITSRNVVCNEKSMKPPCHEKCRLKCYQRFTEEERRKIHSHYWNAYRSWDSKRQFILSCIKTLPVSERIKKGTTRRKTKIHKFNFNINNQEELVCKTFFRNTLSISEAFMRTALSKVTESGLLIPDLRGRHTPKNKITSESKQRIKDHITKFPVYESRKSRGRSKCKYLGNHLNISIMYQLYLDECEKDKIKPEKKWVYSKIFNEDFNLSFNLPDNDIDIIKNEMEW